MNETLAERILHVGSLAPELPDINKTQAAELVELGGFEYTAEKDAVVDQNTGMYLSIVKGARRIDHDALCAALDAANAHWTALVDPAMAGEPSYRDAHLGAREALARQFRGGRASDEGSRTAFASRQTLGHSHATQLTEKHVYAGTVSSKEKAARRRRNAAARVSRRNNRKGA